MDVFSYVIDDMKDEILKCEYANRYLMSMVSRRWNVYCKVVVANEYRGFKMLCQLDDMLSIVRSYRNVHINIAVYYAFAFGLDDVMRFFEHKECNRNYMLIGACYSSHFIYVYIHDGLWSSGPQPIIIYT